MHCDTSTDCLVKLFSFLIAYVDPDIAGKWVGEKNAHNLALHWRRDDEAIFSIG
jgi:hypothetical protein